ncbi:MAG: tRNA glutamyl-Q(34) synthetase GluQRS [Actinobacteria bacterium]|nr:tRNA glutamyl-Q(34) synthetase GluQRS [Actinomycetota bacterium]
MAIGRYAPSPTGDLHVGNLRTAVVAWLRARATSSRFVLRVEDLDPASRSGRFVDSQLADLESLGLDWDGDTIRQSDRLEHYRVALEELISAGHTFECFCSRREIRGATQANHRAGASGYPGTCRSLGSAERAKRADSGRPAAIRLAGGGLEGDFVDRIAGPFAGLVDDIVIRRNDGVPAYNLAVVMDDQFQMVEEVVRGDDLLASTPAQIRLCELLGFAQLAYAHVPLVLGPSGERLAKRDGAVSLRELAELGHRAPQILAWIGASLGLCDRDDDVTADDLLHSYSERGALWSTWTLDSADIGGG